MTILLAIFTLVLLPVAYIWDGYVTQTLWNWFAVPLGAPKLTLVGAIGLSVLVTSFYLSSAVATRVQMAKAPDPSNEDEKAMRNFTHFVLLGFAIPLLSYVTGMIVHHFQ